MPRYMKCLKCGSENVHKNGELLDLGDTVQKFILCDDCECLTVISFCSPVAVNYYTKAEYNG